MKWYWNAITKHYVDFKGRARRKEYWMFILINMVITLPLAALKGTFELVWPYYVYHLVILLPSIAIIIRRLHDVGKSGWWTLGLFVPFLNFYVIYLFCCNGEKGLNAWGPSPKAVE